MTAKYTSITADKVSEPLVCNMKLYISDSSLMRLSIIHEILVQGEL